MKATKKFLENLSGLTPESAEAIVKEVGLISEIVGHDMAIPMIARPNTIIIWLNGNGLVSKATKGW